MYTPKCTPRKKYQRVQGKKYKGYKMAINMKEYDITVEQGIKTEKTYNKFLLYFRYKEKRYKRVLNFTNLALSKKDKILKAKQEVLTIKAKHEIEESRELTLKEYAKIHFKDLTNTKYNKTKLSFYDRYIGSTKIANKKMIDILERDIKNLINKNEHLSPKTQSVFLEILNPMFKEAIANRECIYNPCSNIKIKIPKSKKIILNANEKLKELAGAVESVYRNDDFYYCMFFFYIQGRRKSEVLKLEWKNIDIKNKFYVIEDTKNGEKQKFILLDNIINRIKNIPKINKYVFASNLKLDDHIKNIDWAIDKIKQHKKSLNDFTLKDTRNIITSAMGESGENAIYQSGTLGHRSLKTIDKYSTLSYVKGSEKANEVINKIIK